MTLFFEIDIHILPYHERIRFIPMFSGIFYNVHSFLSIDITDNNCVFCLLNCPTAPKPFFLQKKDTAEKAVSDRFIFLLFENISEPLSDSLEKRLEPVKR